MGICECTVCKAPHHLDGTKGEYSHILTSPSGHKTAKIYSVKSGR